jgi:hypothetical protein
MTARTKKFRHASGVPEERRTERCSPGLAAEALEKGKLA